MSTYVEKYNGYIADNPNIEFVRCDGHVFTYDEVNTASMSDSSESITINGGQSKFPLAVIDTSRTLEFTFDSSEFTMEMFAMANGVDPEVAGETQTVLESKRYEVEQGLKIVIPGDVTKTIYIAGLVKGDAPAEGTYTATYASDNTTVTFDTKDVAIGDTIRVAYERPVDNAAVVTVTTTATSARGALWAHWPVYAAGDDCADSAIKAWLHLHIYSVRVTAMPGFDSSYKTANTNSVTFTSLDPKKAGGQMYELIYEIMED